MRQITQIVVHHSEHPSWGFNEIRNEHMHPTSRLVAHPWRDIRYNAVIETSGAVKRASYGDNSGNGGFKGVCSSSLEVCVCGNFDKGYPSHLVLNALKNLLVEWCNKYKVHASQIKGHRDVQPRKYNVDPITKKQIGEDWANTCPGEQLYRQLPQLRNLVTAEIAKATPRTFTGIGHIGGRF